MSVFHLLLITVSGWLDRREPEALADLIEEKSLLAKTGRWRRLRNTDDNRRRQRSRSVWVVFEAGGADLLTTEL